MTKALPPNPIEMVAIEVAWIAAREEFYADVMRDDATWRAFHEAKAGAAWVCYSALTEGSPPLCRPPVLQAIDWVARNGAR